jgi:3-hydroxyisobutyrate dehydrogenase-like beta-hydroxyacid dehydrogenase
MAERGTLTLLFAAREERFNNARVLAEFLEEELERRGPSSSPVCYAD